MTKEAVQCFEEVADRNVMFRGRDGQPPWEFVNEKSHGVHAGLCGGFVEHMGGKAHGGSVRVGRKGVGGKRGIVDDGWYIRMESEERMDGDGAVR